ncbi:hypothetical protein DI392_03630 [Vibrio albus]|uniref:Uncharacterized protein n=1 Tax=Vibrio albus TaxID=2200953 RepID=A0A2U3BBP9_9VIBR|nr:hypothetical protein [Vibrio albus]PWI34219.1 hypothetical protein DI392_03630 [Vibrio albus]
MKYLMLSILAVLMSLSAGVMAKQDPQDAPGQGADFQMRIDCGIPSDTVVISADGTTLNQVINGFIYELCKDENIFLDLEDGTTVQEIGATFKDTAEDIAADVALQIAYHYDYTVELTDHSCQVLRLNPGGQTKLMCDTQEGVKNSLTCEYLTEEEKIEIKLLCHDFE